MNYPPIRHPAVAGHFYKGSPEALRKQVEAFIEPGAERKKAVGILAPHAGLMYSGSVAGAVYSRIELPDIFVLIGPNHTGLGPPVSLMASGSWETPLGRVAVDETLAAAILARSPRIREDTLAHLREHSLEVQLPFIQYLKGKKSRHSRLSGIISPDDMLEKDDSGQAGMTSENDFRIVPIQMLDNRLETCIEVGRAVGEAIKESSQKTEVRSQKSNDGSGTPNSKLKIQNSQPPLIVASSDMTHYENADAAREKDMRAIRRILELDPEGLHREIKDCCITMCGCGPAVVMLVASKLLGATKAELVKYANSGEVSGDYEQVVGYAGIVVR